ncbi:MAG: ribulose-phosphate 3-epimerase [Candidatus Woesearchaeota archaeon]
MLKIIPTVFSKSLEEFNSRLNHLSFSKYLHVDIMDGKFVKSNSVNISELPLMEKECEAHLMVENPSGFIEPLVKSNFKKIIFHVESKSDIKATLMKIKSLGASAMLAINPKTNVGELVKHKDFCNEFLVMGVEPGAESQEFIESTIDKIKEIKQKIPSAFIQVDGGVNESTIKKLNGLVDAVNLGSYFNNAKEPLDAYIKLLKVLN